MKILFAALLTCSSLFGAEVFEIDPVHSNVLFRSGHFGIGYVHGRFNDFAGKLRAVTAFTATVKATSVDTNQPKRDEHLRTADFFDVATYPTITFKSITSKETDAGSFLFEGELELHGVKRPISVVINRRNEGKDAQGRHRYGLYGSFDLKRSEYGMNKLLSSVDDEVSMTLAFEGIRK